MTIAEMDLHSERCQSSLPARPTRCVFLFVRAIPSCRNTGRWLVRPAGVLPAGPEISGVQLRWAHRLEVYVPKRHVRSIFIGRKTSAFAPGSKSCAPKAGTGNSLG